MTKTTYFQWLCDLVHCEKKEKSYYKLLKIMFDTEFLVKNKNDINRGVDGCELRTDYYCDCGVPEKDQLFPGTCSILEMIIGISKRMMFELAKDGDDDESYFYHYFWEILDNLHLTWFDDKKIEWNPCQNTIRIKEILRILNERKYQKNGEGGMFPLRNPSKNQKRVEIWYQMQAYINEKYNFEDTNFDVMFV